MILYQLQTTQRSQILNKNILKQYDIYKTILKFI